MKQSYQTIFQAIQQNCKASIIFCQQGAANHFKPPYKRGTPPLEPPCKISFRFPTAPKNILGTENVNTDYKLHEHNYSLTHIPQFTGSLHIVITKNSATSRLFSCCPTNTYIHKNVNVRKKQYFYDGGTNMKMLQAGGHLCTKLIVFLSHTLYIQDPP